MFGDHHQPRDLRLAGLPRAVELVAHPRADRLHQRAHWLAGDGNIALDPQDIEVPRHLRNSVRQRGQIGHGGQLHDDRVEIVMLVVVMPVMVRGARGQVILGRRFQTQDHGGINRAIGHLDHRQLARSFGLDHGACPGDPLGPGQIAFGQQHHIGARDLIFEHLGQGCFVVDAVIGGALGIHRRHVRCEPARRDGFRVGQRDHAVNRDAAADRRPVERLQERLWQRQARGFDQDMIGARFHRQQRLDSRHEVIGHGAADAAIGQFDDVFRRAIGDRAALQDFAIHPQRAEFIDHDG